MTASIGDGQLLSDLSQLHNVNPLVGILEDGTMECDEMEMPPLVCHWQENQNQSIFQMLLGTMILVSYDASGSGRLMEMSRDGFIALWGVLSAIVAMFYSS